MLKLKRELKVIGQNVWALVALGLLILSLPPITILAAIHYCKVWISEMKFRPQREMSRI
jgi:hypothetical protein